MSKIIRILIVDDDHNMTRTLCDILAASGFSGETATDAQEGLLKLEQSPFEVVMTDIRMPGMNGVDFQQVIKEKYPETRVILMTAYADYDLISRGRMQGALAFLDKPLNIPLLLSMLRVVREGAFRMATPPPGSGASGTSESRQEKGG
jgi:DNA-binding NtrC family response regulator